jgi:hypothetical protein
MESIQNASVGGYGVVGASLARAEEALCRSMVAFKDVKGTFGEMVMDRVVLGTPRGGGWEAVGVSAKPQGIDGLYVKRDRSGAPRDLLVGEAKFGGSRLGVTKDGKQLSTTWTPPRLAAEAARRLDAGSRSSVHYQPRPIRLGHDIDTVKVKLPDGREGHFWRISKSDPWSYDGPRDSREAAQRAAVRDGRFLQKASDGSVRVRQRLFKVDVNRNTISVKIADARSSSPADVSLKEIAKVEIDAATRKVYISSAKAEIARQLRVKNANITEAEAKLIAESATRKIRDLEALLQQRSQGYWVSAAKDMGIAAGVGGALSGVIDAAGQMYSRGQVDLSQVAGMAAVGAGATGAGSAVQHLVVGAAANNAVVHEFFVETARAIGLPTGMTAASTLGQGAGGVVGSGVYALAMWMSGAMSDGEALRCFSSGAASSMAGAAAGAGVLALATTCGTAGSGVAISSLSGAAAHGAALAYIGGGSAAAGGGGAALGAAIVGGVVLGVAIVGGAVIYWGYAVYDDSDCNARHRSNAAALLENEALRRELCRRKWPVSF